ncbi:MAG: phage portal protein [Patescibacteria group bacterium]|nr:phage portal protein [Patescibacteria group bacterium]
MGTNVSNIYDGVPQWLSGLGQVNPMVRPLSDFIQGMFGPQNPTNPYAVDMPDAQSGRPDPRRYEYTVGHNLPHYPGSSKLIQFKDLRAYADRYSVVRTAIEIRKKEICGLEWDIVPTREAHEQFRTDRAALKEWSERKNKAVAFFKRPDPEYRDIRSWLNALLEHVFVDDAVAIYPHPTRVSGKGPFGSDLAALDLIDGSTIYPLVDLHGATPRPPAPAYQQYLYGAPRVDLATVMMESDEDRVKQYGAADSLFFGDQLIYAPYNQRTWTKYGFSPLEQAFLPVRTGLNRQEWRLDFYTEGSTPAMWIVAPPEFTPTQIRQLQDALNLAAGDMAAKWRLRVLPGGAKTELMKPPDLSDKADGAIIEEVLIPFQIKPMELGIMTSGAHSLGSKGMNEQSSESADKARFKPVVAWLEDFINFVLVAILKQDDMRFKFLGLEEEEDDLQKAQAQDMRIRNGSLTIDEARAESDLEPYGLPESSEPLVYTANGVVPISGQSDLAQAKNDAAKQGLNALAQGEPGAQGGEGADGGEQQAVPPQPKPTNGGGQSAEKPVEAPDAPDQEAQHVAGKIAEDDLVKGWVTIGGNHVFIGGGGGGGAKQEPAAAAIAATYDHQRDIAMQHTVETGGATVRAFSQGQKGIGDSGYGVSPYPDRSAVIDGKLSEDDVNKYVETNADLLQKDDHYLGIWQDTESGKTYLDVSVVKATQEEAESLGKQADQIAIFDYHAGNEIRIGGSGGQKQQIKGVRAVQYGDEASRAGGHQEGVQAGHRGHRALHQRGELADQFEAELRQLGRFLRKGNTRPFVAEYLPSSVVKEVTGRFVAGRDYADWCKAAVRIVRAQEHTIQRLADKITEQLGTLAIRLRDGDLSSQEFVDQAQALLQEAYKEGLHLGAISEFYDYQTTNDDIDTIVQHADQQRPYLEQLARDIVFSEDAQSSGDQSQTDQQQGGVPWNQIQNRLGSFGDSVGSLFSTGTALGFMASKLMTKAETMATWHAQADPCDLCAEKDGESWTLDDLPGYPGDGGYGDLCEGGPKCRCWLTYEKVEQENPDALVGQELAA